MAVLAAIPAWAYFAASIAGTAMTVAGQRAQARSEAQFRAQQATMKEVEAKQLETRAIQDVAVAQRSAQEEQRRSRIIQSRALALAAASGGSASDPTVVNIISDLAGEGAYRSAVAMYEGEDQARTDRMAAAAARYEGAGLTQSAQSVQRSANYATAGTVFSSVGSMYGKYGMPSSSIPSGGTPGTYPYR